MKMESSIFGLIRGAGAALLKAVGAQEQLALDPFGGLVVSQGLPPLAELVRQGQSWYKVTDAENCVTAIPTTTAPHTFWNGNPTGGKSMVIDRLSWMCSVSAAAASMFSMVGMVNRFPLSAQAATADTATGVQGLAGSPPYTGGAKTSHTVTVVNDGWLPLSETFHSGALTATVGISLVVPVEGRIVLPPGYALSLAVLAANTTAEGVVGFAWHEMQLPG